MANIMPIEKIENKILLIRGEKVMLDRDLAAFYGVETRALIQAVKRNKERFPEDFMFQLIKMEAEYLASEGYLGESLRSQFVISNEKSLKNIGKSTNLRSQFVISKRGGTRYPSYVFTEPGVAMLSSVLKSKKAVEINIAIMRAFIKIRQLVYSYKELVEKIEKIEREHGKKIGNIFSILNKLMAEESKPKKEIGFKA